jgi:hypothetical protein
MDITNRYAKAGAVCYMLWGVVHVLGAGFQLFTLRTTGAAGLTALVSSAQPTDLQALGPIPPAAAAFMGMGAMNLLWIGALVTTLGATLNWRNSALGYWLNLGIVAGTDVSLLLALLLPGIMSWSDGGIGLSLFGLAVSFSTLGRRAVPPVPAAQPA